MAFSVVMPALEMAQETGKLVAWRKKEGDRVTKGEPLLEIETDKAVMEVEAPADGVLAAISGAVGADIPVGQTIAWIVDPGEKPPAGTSAAAAVVPMARAGSPHKAESRTTEPAVGLSESAAIRSARISPKARRLAKELRVDIARVRGSGPGGEILASDVQAAAGSSRTVASEKKSVETLSTLGRLMAERTTQSWTTVPHFFVSREVDATSLNEYRKKIVREIERSHQVRITHTDLLIAIAARVLLKHPRLNASWTSDGIRLHDHVNMGVAISVNDGVIAAVLPNAHTAGLAEIARQRRDVTERARAGKLRPADIADATFTISNLGMHEVDSFSAIIIPPQAAILAVGTIVDRVVAAEGKAVVRPMMTLTLSCDHRVVDGAHAAMFLKDLSGSLEQIEEFLVLEDSFSSEIRPGEIPD
jgi:pyruvate dehydrogenase E2 component (dihydrolipoamide acetyltransferase)